MIGAETPVITQGQKLSILLALAISRAPALHGLAKRLLGAAWAGFPGCAEEGWASGIGCRRDGERVGEEKESRYRPMKNSSLRAQQMKSTTCSGIFVSAVCNHQAIASW